MTTVIRGATLIDGSGAPSRRADVAISGDTIIDIAAPGSLSATEVIDADGLTLAPGFIDVHTHDDAAALAPEGLLPKISQGVTTVVTGNCGISLAPAPGGGSAPPAPPLDLLGGRDAYAFPRFADFLAALAARPPDANVYPLVGHTVLRSRAMSELDRPATEPEVASMRADLVQVLAEGARGLSTGLAYPPARFATSDEVADLVAETAAAGGLWTTHMRDERSGVVASVAETIATARATGVRTLISHHKCCGEAAFGLSATTLAMIDAARRDLPIDLDVYPYTASSTVLIESFARDSRRVAVSWSEPHPEAAGRDLSDIAAEWAVDEMTALDRLRPGGAIYHQMDDGDLERILAYPPSLVGSDGLPNDRRPHPRLWGAFPRVLGRYARDRGLLSLEQAVAKMTGQTARVLGLDDRGLVAPGMKADLVLFNADEIADAATYSDPIRPALGLVRTWVNGAPAFAMGAPSDTRSGRVLTS